MKANKTYLGDGAYAEFQGYCVKLTTEDGVSAQNEIVLEPEHMTALIRFLKEKGIIYMSTANERNGEK